MLWTNFNKQILCPSPNPYLKTLWQQTAFVQCFYDSICRYKISTWHRINVNKLRFPNQCWIYCPLFVSLFQVNLNTEFPNTLLIKKKKRKTFPLTRQCHEAWLCQFLRNLLILTDSFVFLNVNLMLMMIYFLDWNVFGKTFETYKRQNITNKNKGEQKKLKN